MNTRKKSKYIFDKGRMIRNPSYTDESAVASTLANPEKSLAIISSTKDIEEASELQESKLNAPLEISQQTQESFEVLQSEKFLEKFEIKNSQLDGGELIDALSSLLSQYEVPVGLINKLLSLTEYQINFIIDDSGSMTENTDVKFEHATSYVKTQSNNQNQYMTRWQEVQDRLHIMFDLLAYFPTTINLRFLNDKRVVEFKHANKSPEQFAKDAHQAIAELFNFKPVYRTPLYSAISDSFNSAKGKTIHYVLTDGDPTDASIRLLKELIVKRKNPMLNPITFISCTNMDIKWMKEVDAEAPYTAEVDDFYSEQAEVLKNQGPALPFSRGIWILCQLVGAINPYDLDAIDESEPFTRFTLNSLLGYQLRDEDYKHYFENHPMAKTYAHLYKEFQRDDILTHQIKGTEAYKQYEVDHKETPQQKVTQSNSFYYRSWLRPDNQQQQQVNDAKVDDVSKQVAGLKMTLGK